MGGRSTHSWWAHQRDRAQTRTEALVVRARNQRGWVDHLFRAFARYRTDRVDYYSLVVVYRGLFLAFSMMLILLYVLGLVTATMPGMNEIAIPIATLPAEQDFGRIVNETVKESQGAVLNVLGIATLVISATYTAKALRQGTARVLRPELHSRVRLLHPSNLFAGLALALVVLMSWLLGLATAIRTAAIDQMLGVDASRLGVNIGKGAAIVAAELLLTLAVFIPLRRVDVRHRTREILLASAVLAAFIVGSNFVLLYSFIVALLDSDGSGGVVLVLTTLAWVNVVSRGLFFTECWIAEVDSPSGSVA